MLESFEEGLVESLTRRYAPQGLDVQAVAADVERGFIAGKVRSPNGCLIAACKSAQAEGKFRLSGGPAQSAARAAQAAVPAPVVRLSDGYPAFRHGLLVEVLAKRLAPYQLAEKLGEAVDVFPQYRADLLAEAARYALAMTWEEVR